MLFSLFECNFSCKIFKTHSLLNLYISITDQNYFKFSALKHSPSKKGKKDSAIRRISNIKATNVASVPTPASVDNTAKNSANADEVSVVTEKISNMCMATAANKPESITSSQNGKLDCFRIFHISSWIIFLQI